MKAKLTPVVIFVLIAVMAVPLFTGLISSRKVDPIELASLDVGPARVIRITVEQNSQQTLSLHYYVEVDGQTVIDHAFFGTLPRTATPPSFVVYAPASGSGGVVGIAQAAVPNRIVILHDFDTGESYPYRDATYKDTDPDHLYPYYEQQEAIEARGEALFVRLQEALPDTELDLLRTMGLRPLAVPDVQPEAENAE